MKATLEFNLPEDEAECRTAFQAGDLRTALWDIREWARGLKHTDSDVVLISRVQQQIWNLVGDLLE